MIKQNISVRLFVSGNKTSVVSTFYNWFTPFPETSLFCLHIMLFWLIWHFWLMQESDMLSYYCYFFFFTLKTFIWHVGPPKKRKTCWDVGLLPICVWPNLHHSRPFPIQHLLWICHIEEVKLHVDRCRRIFPGSKSLCSIFQKHFL